MYKKLFRELSSGKHGISSGSLLFVVRWLSVTLIIFSSELLIRYNLLGFLAFIILIGISLVFLGSVGQKVRTLYPNSNSILSIIQLNSSDHITKFYSYLFLCLSIGLLVIQSIAVHLMLSTIFTIPFVITQFIFFSLCFIYIGISKRKVTKKAEPFFIIILFMTVIFIPLYNFVQKGIEPVYNGVWLYHPYILYWQNGHHFQLFTTIFIFLMSIIVADRVTWQRIFVLDKAKIRRTTTMAGFILSVLLLGVSSLLLISLAQKSFNNAATILFTLIQDLQAPILQGLFLAFCLIISLPIISLELQVISKIITKEINKSAQKKQQTRKIHPMITLLCMTSILYIVSLFPSPSIVTLFTFYGIVCIAISATIYHIAWLKSPLNIYHILATIISIIIGWTLLIFTTDFIAILTTFILTLTIFILLHFMHYHTHAKTSS